MIHDRQITTIARLLPEKPIVGYDSHNEYQAMKAVGFQGLGLLRVWMSS